MAYPSSLDNLKDDYQGTDQADVVDHAGMHNAERTAINAVQAELGTEPKGSAASVKARLDGIEAGTRLGAGSVATAALATGAVTADKLATDSVTAAKIAANAVGADEIAAGAVGTDELAADAVTSAKILDGTIVDADISATAAIAVGKLAGAYTAKTANYTITSADSVVAVGTTSGAVTLTLPAASGMTGKALRIVKTGGANTLTISRAGSDTISPSSGGRTSVAFPSATHGEMLLVSSGTGWWVVSGTADDETVGRRRWAWDQALAAGSTTAGVGWQLIHADTGLRDITAALNPAHLLLNPNATATIRRINFTVFVTYANGASPTATGGQTVYTLPVAFQDSGQQFGVCISPITGLPVAQSIYPSAAALATSGNVSGQRVLGSVSYSTAAAWPSTLPGSASGSIPTGA